MFSITIEGKKSISQIQRDFESVLSEKEILKTTAFAINETSRRVISKSKKDIKVKYTVDRKYLDRLAKVRKLAKGTNSGLYSEIWYNRGTVPMIGFKSKSIGKKGGISVEIIKGQPKTLKHAFMATMKSGHEGVFATGRYLKGKGFINSKERTASGKSRITEMKTASPYSMFRNNEIERMTVKYVNQTLPSRTKALLQMKVNKLTK